MTAFNILLFDDFETLDAFGPAEIIGKMPKTYKLNYFSMEGGIVTSSQQAQVMTIPADKIDHSGILLIPGGMGTRTLINDADFIEKLACISSGAVYVLTVCTGSALLAKTGLLDGKRATSNKMAFEWVQSTSAAADWVKQARWVVDGNVYTSSGVSAGMDMTLGFIGDVHGEKAAQNIAGLIEYTWHADKDADPFALETI